MSCLISHRVVFKSRLLDLNAKKSRVIRHVKPPPCKEASNEPRALSWDRTQAIGALAHSFKSCATRAPMRSDSAVIKAKRSCVEVRDLNPIVQQYEQLWHI